MIAAMFRGGSAGIISRVTDESLVVKFWGVRGSFPTPGPATVRVGGNTLCVSLMKRQGPVLVFDAGTGIRLLGRAIGEGRDVYLLMSHQHADHTQGLPFFRPLYQAGRRVSVLQRPGESVIDTPLLRQFDGVNFPFRLTDLRCTLEARHDEAAASLTAAGITFTQIATNHPGGANAYRVEWGGRSVVYMTDNELAAEKPTTTREQFADFIAGADLLIHDTHYLDAEIAAHRGWGHSTVEAACTLATAGKVKRLALFHHDPDRDDAAIDEIEQRARKTMKESGVDVFASREWMELAL